MYLHPAEHANICCFSQLTFLRLTYDVLYPIEMLTMERDADYIRVHLRVTGLVQGVGFRYWTRSVAARLMITGHVRNMADRSVEITATGSAGVLEEFLRIVKQGPSGALVERLEILDRRVSTDTPGCFSVLR